MSQTLSSKRAAADPEQPATRRPSLLFFFSPTSGASRRADGFLAHVLQRRANHSTFRLHRIDAERCPDLVHRLRITDVPTLLVIVDGRVSARISKPSNCTEISQLLAPWLR